MAPLPPDDSPPPGMLQAIDKVLRGAYTRPEALAGGRVEVPAGILLRLGVLLGVVYGLSLGSFGVFHGGQQPWAQMLAAGVKVPLLFLLTLAVTFPSLYVFSALLGSAMKVRATLRLLLVAIAVNVAVLASLGPVFAFFAASTPNYSFMVLLNVLFFGVAGLIGLGVLRRAAAAACRNSDGTPAPSSGRAVLTVWCLVYGCVGAQMGWLLRPFLGAPNMPFALLRDTEANFFSAVVETLRALFRG